MQPGNKALRCVANMQSFFNKVVWEVGWSCRLDEETGSPFAFSGAKVHGCHANHFHRERGLLGCPFPQSKVCIQQHCGYDSPAAPQDLTLRGGECAAIFRNPRHSVHTLQGLMCCCFRDHIHVGTLCNRGTIPMGMAHKVQQIITGHPMMSATEAVLDPRAGGLTSGRTPHLLNPPFHTNGGQPNSIAFGKSTPQRICPEQ